APDEPVLDLATERPIRPVDAERELRETELDVRRGVLAQEPRQIVGLDAHRPLDLGRISPELATPAFQRRHLRYELGRPLWEGGVIERPWHVREELRVPVRVARDERAELDAARLLDPSGERRPAFEVRAVRVTVERKEVIPVVDEVGAELLRAGDSAAQHPVG